MTLEDLINKTSAGAKGKIIKTQTTFLEIDLAFAPDLPNRDNRYRIHYQRKHEFSVHAGGFTSIQLTAKHPLLFEYIEPKFSLQLVSEVGDKPRFLSELNKAANIVFNGWRSADAYSFMPIEEFIKENYGILMIAPKTFATAVLKVADHCDVKLAVDEGQPPAEPLAKLLFFDSMYVIADDFHVQGMREVTRPTI